MKLTEIQITEIGKRVQSGLITAREHPTLPYTILNYTNSVQWNYLWDEYTEMCRGLIIDEEANIVSNPFPKFFTFTQDDETKEWRTDGRDRLELPNTTPIAFDKLDGSLGIQYIHDDDWGVATRGMFNSDIADFATDWIKSKFAKEDFNPDWTYLYEIIYPENRIIVDYGDRTELVLLSVRDTHTGEEMDYISEAKRLGLSYAESFPYSFNEAIEHVKNFDGLKNEGFVLLYPCGLRVKLKTPDYLVKFKAIERSSEKHIVKLIIDGKIEELLDSFPDELYPEIHEISNRLMKEKEQIKNHVNEFISSLPEGITNKEIAKLAKGRKDIHAIFAKINGKEIDNMILKSIIYNEN